MNSSFDDSITFIGHHCFEDYLNIQGNLIIPNNVVTIGNSSFENCTGLIGDLIIPDSVTDIYPDAFHSCSGFNGSLNFTNLSLYLILLYENTVIISPKCLIVHTNY